MIFTLEVHGLQIFYTVPQGLRPHYPIDLRPQSPLPHIPERTIPWPVPRNPYWRNPILSSVSDTHESMLTNGFFYLLTHPLHRHPEFPSVFS